eukprot:Nitzschia sp. Nitz4//scaffold73_size107353//103417//104296//NITZ4_004334-RA/size107353-snap-gene-0.114-mRNA-1//-1//CDS//3329557518//265//frame0
MAEVELTAGNHPTLQDIESQEEEEDEETKRWRDMERTLFTRVIQGTAFAAIILNLLAMIWEASGIVVIAGILALGIGSAVIYFQFALQDMDSLRQVHNKLRHDVNKFAGLNVKLGENNSRLESELAPLKDAEMKLTSIAEESGSNVAILRDAVRENQKTLDKMQDLIKKDILLSMMEAVLESERNEDSQFSDRELKRLVLRLKGLPSITMNEERFLAKAQQHRSMSDIFNIMNTIADTTIPEEERIFSIAEVPEDV